MIRICPIRRVQAKNEMLLPNAGKEWYNGVEVITLLKVFLVEDECVVREGLRDCIDWERYGFEFCGDAPDGELALPQIRKFMDYYLPTTLKLLNAYDRMGAQGVSGENIDATMQRVESMMGTIVTAFEKQLDMLFGSEAMDISADITVLENMMKREVLSEDDGELHAESGTATAGQDDIKLEL